MTFDEVVDAVRAERERQASLGWTNAHDRGHVGTFWVALLMKHMGDVALANHLGETVGKNGGEPLDYERELVQLIAVACAALEA